VGFLLLKIKSEARIIITVWSGYSFEFLIKLISEITYRYKKIEVFAYAL
jgi:hypothetical protein